MGIIFTTLVLTVAFSHYKPTLSADEIREEAKKLGMVEGDESASGNAVEKKNSTTTTTKTGTKTTTTKTTTEEPSEKDKEDSKKSEDSKESKDDKKESKTDSKKSEESSEDSNIKVVVTGGEVSDVVSERLEEKGLVKDGGDYNAWLVRHGYDNSIRPGVYYIEEGSSYKEITKILSRDN